MPKIMAVDAESSTRDALKRILTKEGHEVIEAANGSEALEIVGREKLDIVLLDVSMPVMDGFEVLRRLRANPATQDLQVVLMTPRNVAQYEKAAMDLGVEHCIPKPLEPGVVKLTVRVALRNAETATSPIRVGERLLDEKLGGGIASGSLVLVEGTSSAGKSVLCQHFMSRALRDGHRVACFTSENSVKSLISQMASLGLEVADDVRNNRFRIHALEEPAPDADRGVLLMGLTRAIQAVPREYRVICVDAITNLASASEDHAIISFFSACKRTCSGGRTIILVAHSSAFDERMLVRLRSLCDAHLSLRVENAGGKQARVLEVCKVQNSEGMTGNLVFFTVEHKIGMRTLPFSKARA